MSNKLSKNNKQIPHRQNMYIYLSYANSLQSASIALYDSLGTGNWGLKRVYFRLTGRTRDCSNALSSHDTYAEGRIADIVNSKETLKDITYELWF